MAGCTVGSEEESCMRREKGKRRQRSRDRRRRSHSFGSAVARGSPEDGGGRARSLIGAMETDRRGWRAGRFDLSRRRGEGSAAVGETILTGKN